MEELASVSVCKGREEQTVAGRGLTKPDWKVDGDDLGDGLSRTSGLPHGQAD